MTYALSKNVQKLVFLLWFIIPCIPVALIWSWMSPVGFWESIVMFLICICLYVVFLVAELILYVIFWGSR